MEGCRIKFGKLDSGPGMARAAPLPVRQSRAGEVSPGLGILVHFPLCMRLDRVYTLLHRTV